MEKLTHWKKETNPNYLGRWDFIIGADDNNKPIYEERVTTVSKVELAEVIDMENIKKNPKARKKETLVYFAEFEKPMIVHAKTNFKGMENATGTPFKERWVDKKVCIWVEKDVKSFGEITDALRIKPVPKRICEVCGKIISEEIYQGSIKKYNRAFCSAECKEKGEK